MSIPKNTAINGFPFTLVNRTTGEAVTTGVCIGYYTGDDGVQRTLNNTPVHKGNGQWTVDIESWEVDFDVVGLLFIHASAVPVEFSFLTTTSCSSGSSGGSGNSCDACDDNGIDIAEAVSSPKRVRTVEGTVEERPISESIEADRYLAGKCAGQNNAPWGMRIARTRPSSPLGGGRNPTAPGQY